MSFSRYESMCLTRVSCCLVFLTLFLSSCSAKSADSEEGHLAKRGKNSFADCVAEGGKILRSYPAQCVSLDGTISVDRQSRGEGDIRTGEDVQTEESRGEAICIDHCGDKVCQQIVCLGSGCSCAETPESCPQDCGLQAGF